ncbi:MAG: ComEC/Rec2 family competence protein [Anaerolineaceae bacterium]|nr:ComEC/Rec2 family competence protein [Anaerolineaceae bacterium]MBN2677417.1 ComEC/Rec2 family competence protein [Anaerolineaceae bacterium]
MLPPLTWVALTYLAGLIFAKYAGFSLSAGIISLTGALGLWLMLLITRRWPGVFWLIRKSHRLGLPPILLILSFIIGLVRMQAACLPLSEGHLAWYNEKGVVTIIGVITDYPDRRNASQLITVKTHSLSLGLPPSISRPIMGKVIVTTGITTAWEYGDEIRLTGRLSTPSDEADFSYREYLAHHSIHSSLYYPEIIFIDGDHGNPIVGWIYALRSKAQSILSIVFPAPESALLSGILLGIENDIPPDIQTAFRNTGTTHIIAISGFNISILAALFSIIFYRFFGPQKGALITAITLGIYVILTGASPSVVRAAIMGSLGLFASLIGRRQTGVNSLAFTGAIMCLVNPFLPWDISFQLSFMATLGLILFAGQMSTFTKQILYRLFKSRVVDKVADPIAEYCLYTIAALITTFPIMAYHFHAFSWLALISNPLILPAQPAVMILGGLALLLSLLWLPLGQLVAYLAWPFLAYTIKVVELLNATNGNPIISIHLGVGFFVLYYAIIFLVFLLGTGSFIKRLMQPGLIILLCSAVVAILWRTALSTPDGKLHVVIFENGPSESVLLQSPTGRYILIGGGSQSSQLSADLGKWLPPHNHSLDLVFLPVTDKQSIRSISHGTNGVTIDHLIWIGDPARHSGARDLCESISVNKITSSMDLSQTTFQLAPDVFLRFTMHQTDNGVFFLNWKDFFMLIPINIDRSDWLIKSLNTQSNETFSVIQLAANGDQEHNPRGIIRLANPTLIIVNSAPGESTTGGAGLYEDISMLTTKQNGWVHIITDGSQLWVETERCPNNRGK